MPCARNAACARSPAKPCAMPLSVMPMPAWLKLILSTLTTRFFQPTTALARASSAAVATRPSACAADQAAQYGCTVTSKAPSLFADTDCANGTERCAAALDAMTDVPPIVVNFQGDAPLTPPEIVGAVIERMRAA